MNIQYYRLKKYEEYRELDLDQLIEVYKKVQNGEIDLSKKKMSADRTGRSMTDSIYQKQDGDPNTDNRMIKETRTRRFIIEANKNVIVRGLIEMNKVDTGWIRDIFTTSNITANELAYLMDMKEGSLTYHLKRYGMEKLPRLALYKINTTKRLIEFLKSPRNSMMKLNSNETENEFRERYTLEMQKMFHKVKDLSLHPLENKDELLAMKTAISTFETCMKMEMESKNIIKELDKKKITLKEKEINKSEVKETNVINFNGDLKMQTMFLFMQKALLESGKLDEEEVDALLEGVTKDIDVNGGE